MQVNVLGDVVFYLLRSLQCQYFISVHVGAWMFVSGLPYT